MAPGDQDDLGSIVDEAALLPPHERLPFLQRVLSDKPNALEKAVADLSKFEAFEKGLPAIPYDVPDEPHEQPSPLPEKIGNYRILERIGGGGMGTVYRAKHPKLERHVAIKVISVDAPDVKRRFLLEAQALSKVSSLYVVPIYDFDLDNGKPYIVQPLLIGSNLRDAIERGTLGSLAERLTLAVHIAKGLDALHKVGIAHRDLTPPNVWVREDGSAMLLDLGIARSFHAGATVASRHFGTSLYMPPEQLGSKKSPREAEPLFYVRGDIYSFGAVVWALFAGREPPLPGAFPLDAIVCSTEQDRPLVDRIRNVVGTATQHDMDCRFHSVGEILRSLDTGYRLPPVQPAPVGSNKRKFALLSLAGLAALIVALAIIVPSQRGGRGPLPNAPLNSASPQVPRTAGQVDNPPPAAASGTSRPQGVEIRPQPDPKLRDSTQSGSTEQPRVPEPGRLLEPLPQLAAEAATIVEIPTARPAITEPQTPPDEVAWKKVEEAPTPESIRQFLKQFPSSRFGNQARDMLGRAEWEIVARKPEAEAIEEWMRAHPNHTLSARASELLAAVKAEKRAADRAGVLLKNWTSIGASARYAALAEKWSRAGAEALRSEIGTFIQNHGQSDLRLQAEQYFQSLSIRILLDDYQTAYRKFDRRFPDSLNGLRGLMTTDYYRAVSASKVERVSRFELDYLNDVEFSTPQPEYKQASVDAELTWAETYHNGERPAQARTTRVKIRLVHYGGSWRIASIE